MSIKLLENAFKEIKISRAVRGLSKQETMQQYSEALKFETDKDIYTEEEKNELRRYYVEQSSMLGGN